MGLYWEGIFSGIFRLDVSEEPPVARKKDRVRPRGNVFHYLRGNNGAERTEDRTLYLFWVPWSE